ncbi:hypothetical protein BRC68_09740 [Halobacteriales archaeon QH_6_64_20]|nr:MAG: hypothetical protein BRC68_09740 [Halobacteriales archaeon QH_6_64_20]
MSNNESDPEQAGTNCVRCSDDISPFRYRSSRAVLVNEEGPGPDQEEVKMVCQDCWSVLEQNLSAPSA